jgi:hypothetical protein
MSSLDVIVPCYRYGHFLRECVQSVLKQSLRNVRVLIIDDASPDNTVEVVADLVKEDSRVTFIRHATNKGHIYTYNEGIEWASADYLLILSADDYLLPGALSRSSNFLDAHPEVGFTFGKVVQINDSEPTTLMNIVDLTERLGSRILGGRKFIELSAAGNIVSTPAAVVRTKLQKRLGGYLSELPHSGDMEMWLRFAAHASVGMLEAYQAVYRRHGGNMSLAYIAKGWLPDLRQRKAAFDCFFQTCSYALPNAQQLQRRLFWLLACDAVGLASAAFNDGEMGLSEELSEFALGVCPQIKRSLPWVKLTCKRRLGFRAWGALWPAVARIRRAVAYLNPMASLVRGKV